MSYAERYAKAEKSGEVTDLSMEFTVLDAETPQIIGRIMEIRPFTFPKLGKPTDAIIMDTDTGMVAVLAGLVAVNACRPDKMSGKIVCIRYLGEITEGVKRPYKDYSVKMIAET